MQGSLDQPPITVRSSQSTSLLMLLIAVVLVAIFIQMMKDPEQSRLVVWLGLVLFAACIPLFAWRLIRPDILILAPDGITWRSLLRTVHWSWDDVQGFRAYKPAPKAISKHVGFDFTPSYHAGSSGLRQAAKALTGVEGSLGGGWEIDAAELADLLNRARARWAASSPSAVPRTAN